MIEDYLNQVAEKKGGETDEFFNGPVTDESMLSDIDPTDYEGCYYFTYIWFYITGSSPGTGQIVIVGTDRYGDPQADYISITGDGEYSSTRDDWGSITSITSNGLANETPIPNLVIKIWDQSEGWVTTFGWEEFKCRWEENPLIKPSGGGWDYGDGKVFTKEKIEIDDVLKYEGIEFTVLDCRIHRDLDGEEQYRTLVY
jgi:hypothetical protein